MNDVGAMGAIADCRVIDVVGLVSPELSEREMQMLRSRNGNRSLLGDVIFQYLCEQRPDYVVLFPDINTWALSREAVLQPVWSCSPSNALDRGADTLVVYRPIWAGDGKEP